MNVHTRDRFNMATMAQLAAAAVKHLEPKVADPADRDAVGQIVVLGSTLHLAAMQADGSAALKAYLDLETLAKRELAKLKRDGRAGIFVAIQEGALKSIGLLEARSMKVAA